MFICLLYQKLSRVNPSLWKHLYENIFIYKIYIKKTVAKLFFLLFKPDMSSVIKQQHCNVFSWMCVNIGFQKFVITYWPSSWFRPWSLRGYVLETDDHAHLREDIAIIQHQYWCRTIAVSSTVSCFSCSLFHFQPDEDLNKSGQNIVIIQQKIYECPWKYFFNWYFIHICYDS